MKNWKNAFCWIRTECLFIFLSILCAQIINAQKHTIDSLQYVMKNSYSDHERVCVLNKLSLAYKYINIDTAIYYSNKAIKLAEKNNDQGLAEAWLSNARLFHYKNEIERALISYNQALINFKPENDSINISKVLTEKGYIYHEQGKLIQAIQCYKEANLYSQNIGCLINIANIHNSVGDNQKALEYLLQARSFNIQKLGDDVKNNETIYHLIGVTYQVQGKLQEAIQYTKLALKISQELNNVQFMAHLYKVLGNINTQKGNINEALINFNQSVAILQNLNDSVKLYSVYEEMSKCLLKQGNFKRAIELAKVSYKKGYLLNSSEVLAKAYAIKGNYKEAYEYLTIYIHLSDSIRIDSVSRKISLIENNYQHEQELKIIELEQKQKEIIQIEELKRQKIIRNLIFAGLILTIFIVFFIWRANRLKQKANKLLDEQNERLKSQQSEIKSKNRELDQKYEDIKTINTVLNEQKNLIEEKNAELEAQNEEMAAQRDILATQNQSIHESILYAKRIQTAVLPNQAYIDEILPENFILYKPRNVVSGDFYWVKQINQFILMAVADCTGHGVPGAIMSMLGISFLGEIIQKREITQPAKALNELRRQVKQALRQTGKQGEAEDGMDIALVSLDTKTRIIQFAGAMNPIYMISDNKLQEIRPDRMPVGFYPNEKAEFTNHEIQLKTNDLFYLFSDGYIDQFGGDHGMKYKASNFQKILLENHDKPMQIQKEKLESELQKWMKGYEQTDDILVMGVRV